MNNVMIDLETLDTRHTSVVLSIGAVAFDPERGSLGTEFYRELTVPGGIDEQQSRGRTISGDTLMWWLSQSAAAKSVLTVEALPGVKRTDFQTGLLDLRQYLRDETHRTNLILWANPPNFDLAILRHGFERMGSEVPWKHPNERCFRTLKALAGGIAMPKAGTAHNALDDARNQALHCMKMLGRV